MESRHGRHDMTFPESWLCVIAVRVKGGGGGGVLKENRELKALVKRRMIVDDSR